MVCLFCNIVDGQIPAKIIHHDEHVIAFNDIHPQAPVHVLVIPKQHIADLNALHETWLAGHLLITVKKIAAQLGLEESGYRTVINCNKHGGQEVFHLHVHLLGGRQMTWPPG